ncbi:MAG: sensor domain-containing diguanylate cyclase [Lachnospiraceae bacterium]|nr:sensor domain-containing diguanylate cyclase [Lachnospiraceae bacterium]
MDFESILSAYKTKTCIMSVENYGDGGYGNIRIAAGNKAHCDDMINVMHKPFIPDSPYEEYLPQNKNFEDFCYRCAILGEPLHSYVPLFQMGLWLNIFLLPLESDKENTGYCIYSYDVSPVADPEQMARLSAENSQAVLKSCIKMRGSDDLRETFNEVIEDIREICDSDHCCILLDDKYGRKCINLCEALRPGCGLLPMDTYLNEDFYDIMRSWEGTLADSTCIIIKDERDMEWLSTVNPAWQKSLTEAGARTIVLLPLKYKDSILGYMWALNFDVGLTVKIKETLELTSFFIASEISNYQLLQKMEILSSVDLLTGVKNRNKMNELVDDILSGTRVPQYPYAIVFADLNGLKNVNDENGHGAGDALLKGAAELLKEIFPECEVFRAGGDEFMVVAGGMDTETVEEKIKKLRQREASVDNLHFAIGMHVVSEKEDIRIAMRDADQGMYTDKKEYYAHHPDRRRR